MTPDAFKFAGNSSNRLTLDKPTSSSRLSAQFFAVQPTIGPATMAFDDDKYTPTGHCSAPTNAIMQVHEFIVPAQKKI